MVCKMTDSKFFGWEWTQNLEVATRGVLCRKVFTGKPCARAYFLIKLQASGTLFREKL